MPYSKQLSVTAYGIHCEFSTNTVQCITGVGNFFSTKDSENLSTALFDVLLTVHFSIFILIINQIDAQNLFYNKFISCLYMFRAPCAHRQEVKIVL